MANIAKKVNGSMFEPLTLDRLFRDEVFSGARLPTLVDMRRAFEPIFESGIFPELRAKFVASPLMNVYEKEGTFFVECALPGIKKDDVTIDVAGNLLTISVQAPEIKEDIDKVHYHRRELYRHSISGSVEFPEEIDADRVTAKLVDGVLKLTLIPVTPVKHKAVTIAD